MVARVLRGAPDGAVLPAGVIGQAAAAVLPFAMCSGLVAPLIGRRSRAMMNVALLAHATASATGFVLRLSEREISDRDRRSFVAVAAAAVSGLRPRR